MIITKTAFTAASGAMLLLGSATAHGQDVLDQVQAPNREKPIPLPAPGTAATPSVSVDTPDQTPIPGHDILVGAVVLRGLQTLKPADFADILATRVGQVQSPSALSDLASTIAERARSRGLVFASASIKAQRLETGILVVDVDEGRIDEIRLDGADNPAVRAALASLVDGQPVRMKVLEQHLLIAGDIDGVAIQNSRLLREDGRNILLVQVTRDRLAGRATLANEGTKPLGPEQLTLQADVNGVLASDDSLSLTWSSTAFEPNELQFGRVRYEKRIGSDGTEIAVMASGSVAHPGAYLARYDIESRSWYVGATVLHPLLRRRNSSLWLQGEAGVRNLSQQRQGFQVRDDRLAVLRATLYGYTKLAGGRLRYSSTLSQGLGLLGATAAGDPLASRADADGKFTSLNVAGDWTRDLAARVSIRLGMIGQLSSGPLLISEEMGLGGTEYLRGYDWSQRSGDEGVAGVFELRYLWDHPAGLAKRAQLYMFVDGGSVSNHDGGYGGGALASTGGGIRTDVTQSIGANLEVAVPLDERRYDTNDRTPKINFRLIKAF